MDLVDVRRANLQALVDKSSLSELARKVKRSPSQIGDMLKKRRPIGERVARSMEENAGWEKGSLDRLANGEPAFSNADIVPMGYKKIPVFTTIQAGFFNGGQVATRQTCINNGDFVLVDDHLSDDTFALRIKGNSMEPEFHQGDLVILDPNIAPHPGDYVAARKVDCPSCDAEFTFKKYREVGVDSTGRVIFELVPLNPDYPSFRSDVSQCEVVAVMLEHRIYRKR